MISLDEQLATLRRAGITLTPRVDLDVVLEEEEPDRLNEYSYLLCVLGGIDPERKLPISPNIWHFDSGCIYGEGSYEAILTRLKFMAGNAVVIDHVWDLFEAQSAWLGFTLDGEDYEWEVRLDDDWADFSVFVRFAELLRSRPTPLRLVLHDLKGQDCLIGCVMAEQRRLLNELPGLQFLEW